MTPLRVGLMQPRRGSREGTERCTDLIGVPVSRERWREGMGVTPAFGGEGSKRAAADTDGVSESCMRTANERLNKPGQAEYKM